VVGELITKPGEGWRLLIGILNVLLVLVEENQNFMEKVKRLVGRRVPRTGTYHVIYRLIAQNIRVNFGDGWA